MCERIKMLEAAFDLVEEGVAILDADSRIFFWNQAAAELTGYASAEISERPCPPDLYRVNEEHRRILGLVPASNGDVTEYERPTLVYLTHKLGHSVPGMLRQVQLRTGTASSSGTVLFFYPVEQTAALPHGNSGEEPCIERSQADMEDRLDAAHHQWKSNRMPFGVLWMIVDQAANLRRSHGKEACEAMLRSIEHTLLRQLKPAETIGRWGCNEFLILTHERTPELLLERGHHVAGLARTAEFRWWGDRIGITVSVGACQAHEGDTLQSLLHNAWTAMHTSEYAGGNRVSQARRG